MQTSKFHRIPVPYWALLLKYNYYQDLMQYLYLNLGFLMKGLELWYYRKYSLLRADINKQTVKQSLRSVDKSSATISLLKPVEYKAKILLLPRTQGLIQG